MTREEAIKLFRRDIECLSHSKCSDCILEEACDPMKTPPDSEYIEAYGMAIEALSAEPCEDTISRQAALDAIDTWDKFGVDDTNSLFRLDNLSLPNYVPYIHYDDVIKCIKGVPSVTPKQKMGHWIWQTEDIYRCSECGEDVHVKEVMNVPQYDFCPNCGAKMESGDQK